GMAAPACVAAAGDARTAGGRPPGRRAGGERTACEARARVRRGSRLVSAVPVRGACRRKTDLGIVDRRGGRRRRRRRALLLAPNATAPDDPDGGRLGRQEQGRGDLVQPAMAREAVAAGNTDPATRP